MWIYIYLYRYVSCNKTGLEPLQQIDSHSEGKFPTAASCAQVPAHCALLCCVMRTAACACQL